MRSTHAWLWIGLVGGCLVFGSACKDDASGTAGDAGADGGRSDTGKDGATSDGGASTLLEAPEAKEAGSVMLDAPLSDVVYAEDLALGLHEESGVSILDLSNAKKPQAISKLITTGKPVAVALDAQLRILFALTASGNLHAYRVADVNNPAQIAQATITEPGAQGDTIQGMARVGNRLFLLGKTHLLPVEILFGANGNLSFLAGAEITITGDPRMIAAGGGVLYLALAGGDVQVWSAGEKPAKIDQQSLGGEVVNWVVRGRSLLVGLKGVGLRVVDLSVKGKLGMLFDAPEFDDLSGLVRYGNLVLASLARGKLVALDLSNFAAPRALVTRTGTLPKWIAPINGNLVLGTGKKLSVFGVPPFVSATLPKISLDQLPRYARIPLQLSKPVDPKTVTIDNVVLTCGGKTVAGSVVVSLDNLRITFLPKDTLPAGVTCSLSLGGVKDPLGLGLTSGASALSFSTMSAPPAPVENPHSAYAHTADGAFSDWKTGKEKDFEYFDVTAARGMYSYFYADYDGKKLWLLNDWFYNGDAIEPDCYNQFGVWTGNGMQSWEIRAYGDQHVEVRLNGTLLAADDERVTGGYSRAATPNEAEPHTIYEIAITTEPGSWGVQLHDPGPTFSCHQLETDPTNYNGMSTMAMSTIDPTQGVQKPPAPVPGRSDTTSTTPALTWSGGEGQAQFTSYLVELSTGDDLSHVIYRVYVYGNTLVLPAGLLQDGMTYTWRVTAYNLAGMSVSESATFVYGKPQQGVGAPMLISVDPSSIEQGSSATLTLNGSGFVMGAHAYFDGNELHTTFVSSEQLTAMVPASLTGTAGGNGVVVRNVPSDESTESNVVKVAVTAVDVPDGGTGDVTLVSLDPDTITAGVATSVTFNLTNTFDTSYYVVLTPDSDAGVSSLEPILCELGGNDQCNASLNVAMAGTYDVEIHVGSGAGQYDTNTLGSALTVNKPAAACEHNECLPGARMTSGCSSCVTAICNQVATAYCCETMWDAACVAAANTAQTCDCDPPALVGLNPNTQVSGANTAVTADLTHAVAGQTYTLVLTPNGGGNVNTFQCAYGQQTLDCTAMVMSLAVGSYDAKIRVGSTQTYDSASVTNAFSVTAAPAGTCAAPTCMNTGGEDCTCTTGSAYSMVCVNGTCECKDDAMQVYNDGSGAGVCGSVSAMQDAFMSLCLAMCSDAA